jgi:carbonic anhydrase/acetyltransferase-like protein (isoleucine patch superfamily)
MLVRLGDFAPQISQGVWIAPNATVIGQVVMGVDASVWFGAVIRADNEPIVVGPRSNVQDLCVLHTDPGYPLSIGTDCTIGHQAILHGCTVGDGTLIGMGARVLNGATIGRQSLIGAGSLIPEGMAIPDRSLVVGIPGREKRTLTDDEVERIALTAENYVHRARTYAETASLLTG